MNPEQRPYRELYDALMEYEGDAAYAGLLRPWLRDNDGERRWLGAIRARRGDPLPRITPDESTRLYALSRIVQLLQLSFAPPVAERAWTVPAIGPGEFAEFMEALGLEATGRPDFHPFHHEIVSVDEAPAESAAPELVEVLWPGYTLGPLLVSRAGARVRAGRAHLRKEIAERSTLYWAFARNHRPATDPSAGWGSSSRWRTEFRCDFAIDGRLHYNAFAREMPGGPDDGLSEDERLELLRHRCFVTRARQHDDLWPYGLSHTEPA